ncbi:hypothetical protein B296_00025143 [Ensete ventricosum]|uniref:Uncharacterized protein n=1 Tax=Ensete ventricosum TaxID=4639 RepID=A0A426Y8M0_ENSVE|nr:hypothetical protein B296_00025143 [Ensete ventricosum]
MKLQPDNGPRSSLGIGPGLDDVVGPRRKFARRFTEGIGKLARNTWEITGRRPENSPQECRRLPVWRE